MNNEATSSKLNNLYVILSGIFISNVILAELMGMKIFSITKMFGLESGFMSFFSDPNGEMNMSVGILIWPFVFILSDIVNEYFGKKGVQKMSILGACMILYSSLLIIVGTSLPPSDFWLQLNGTDLSGHPLNIDHAYSIIFRQGISIIIGSVTAFLLSQLVDVYAFHYIRKLTGHKKLWLRATGSTVISQLIDSYVVLAVAFYLLGKWSFAQVLAVGTMQYFYKVGLAILLTPVIYLVHFIIDRVLGRKGAIEVIEETDKNW